LTIAHGHATNTGGGGIQNFGTLEIEDCAFTGNSATRSDGAGVYNAGTLDLSGSTFVGNSSDASGGGLYNSGVATVTQCTFAAGNSAVYGGGIYDLEGRSMTVRDCTISGNHATFGGGMAAPITDASITPALVRVDNTIVAGNSVASEGVGPDVYGFYQSSSTNNLIGALAFATGFDPARNIVGGIGNVTPSIDPMLAPLGNHGGWSQTMPLLPGSLALNAGQKAVLPTNLFADQRGGWRVAGGALDIGAVEGSAGDPTPFASSIRFGDFSGLI
jgi:hypothetical protein